ncbi:MAG: type I restriction-modification system subunit M [Prevotella sp.]|jgi:type I restriction enzyme M protein|nr:type I restriction-modification system subunit M [Prevotella sp.]
MTDITFIQQTKDLIDNLKSVCANYGLGNDGNEFKIITQVFLYKYINDKFRFEARKVEKNLRNTENFQTNLAQLSDDEYEFMIGRIGNRSPILKPTQTIDYLFNRLNEDNFAEVYFDPTLKAISSENAALYSIKSTSGVKDEMFDRLSQFISDPSQRDAFCRALIAKLVNFSFEHMFGEKYDFFATIFEYLIKDYNTDSGGKYAEYYTPHAVARIMAAILVNSTVDLFGIKCYDPSAGSGTLLMNLAHAIGEENCTIYSEDISQKSSNMLRLNLILNNLSQSIPNVIKGNTILNSYYHNEKFHYTVSNPPFKLDFSDYHNELDKTSNKERFFAGIPKIPNKDKDKMAIYLLFIQHIIFCMDEKKGKAAIVVPTGFITAQSGIEKKIREAMIECKILRGVVSMPSNIFASTGTNVSVLFLDAQADMEKIVLVDASKLGETVKDGKTQRTVLTPHEEQRIISAMNDKRAEDNFSVVVTSEEIKAKNHSFSAGQYFEVKIEYVDITAEDFEEKMKGYKDTLNSLFEESHKLEEEIKKQLGGLKYE